jgi:hypothetical protein
MIATATPTERKTTTARRKKSSLSQAFINLVLGLFFVLCFVLFYFYFCSCRKSNRKLILLKGIEEEEVLDEQPV